MHAMMMDSYACETVWSSQFYCLTNDTIIFMFQESVFPYIAPYTAGDKTCVCDRRLSTRVEVGNNDETATITLP